MVHKQTDAEVMYETDPKALIEKAIDKHRERVIRGVAYSLRVVEG